MSLDVYLEVEEPVEVRGSGIRTEGSTLEITREQWDTLHPGIAPFSIGAFVPMQPTESNRVFSANITHNLGKMAENAGIFRALWRPEELGLTKAKELIPLLREGISRLESNPDLFRKDNSSNGWGTYEQLLNFCIGYLRACENWPEATIRVWR